MKTLDGKHVHWSADAAATLRQFLSTPIGQIFLARVQQGRPVCVSGPTVEAAGLAGATCAGYDLCLANLISHFQADPVLATGEPTKEQYPSIDDESVWDGDKPKA